MIGRDMLAQLQHLLRPIAVRAANTVARAVVQLVDDSTKMQLLQLIVLDGETIDGAEHFQPYGLTSVPVPGAEATVIFPNGDRSHPLVVATSDRRYRPTGGQPGEVTLYNNVTPRLILKANGTVEIRSAGGTAIKLPTLADYEALRTSFNAHTHAVAGVTAGGASVVSAVPASTVGSPAGTQVLKAE